MTLISEFIILIIEDLNSLTGNLSVAGPLINHISMIALPDMGTTTSLGFQIKQEKMQAGNQPSATHKIHATHALVVQPSWPPIAQGGKQHFMQSPGGGFMNP